jgi:hypothetical protein
MEDPFLLAHKVRGSIFNLSGRIAPISIRDQMTRAVYIVERALDVGLIRPHNVAGEGPGDLLVLGAGAAGMTAAIWAASQGVSTVLVEQESGPFYRQRQSERYVSPALYDWPMDHWKSELWNYAPLPWKEGQANEIVTHTWQREYEDYARKHGPKGDNLLATRYNSTLPQFLDAESPKPAMGAPMPPRMLLGPDKKTPIGVRAEVVSHKTQTRERLDFGMFLICTGFGEERRLKGDFRSVGFWESYSFHKSNLGCLEPPVVLISGGGDGALQDYLWAVLKPEWRNPRKLYTEMEKDVHRVGPGASRAWNDMLALLHTVDRTVQHYMLWVVNDKGRHAALNYQHEKFEAAIETALETKSVRPAVFSRLQSCLREDIRRLIHVYSCTHYSSSYAINRFLVLLLRVYFRDAEKYGYRQLLDAVSVQPLTVLNARPSTSTEINKLSLIETPQPSEDHTCEGKSASACYGRFHAVEFGPRKCECNVPELCDPETAIKDAKAAVENGKLDPCHANVILIRHGPDNGRLWFKGPWPTFSQHILPYWLFADR